MPTRLSDIVPSELSLVRRGAVRRPFLFAKADDDGFEVDETIAKALAEPADGEHDYLAKTLGDEAEPEQIALAAAAYRLAKSVGADPEPTDDEIAKADADAGDEIFKADFTADQRKQMAANGEAMPDGSYPIPNVAYLKRAIRAVGRGNAPHASIRAHIVKRARALNATNLLPESWNVQKEDRMSEAAVPVKKEDGTYDLSAVPEDARGAVEAVLKERDERDAELVELRKTAEAEKSKADQAIEIAKAERDQREQREQIAKAEQLEKLPAKPDELGAAMHAIAKAEADKQLPDGTVAKLEEILKAADEAIGQGALYAELGRGGAVQKSDAETQLDAKAEEIRKSDSNLTKEQALSRAYRENPSLVEQMRSV